MLSLYALVLAALVMTAGSLADRIGRRAVYLGGLVVFAAASLICGLSGNVGLLIAARGLQGLAAAAMFATTMAFPTLLVTAGLLPAAAWAMFAYQTLWLQSVLGLGPVHAGLVLLPPALTTFAVSVVVGRVMYKVSPRLMISSGMLIIAVGALAQAVTWTGAGWAGVLPGLFLVGLGAGLALGPLSAAAMAAVPGPRAGMAAGAINTFRQLGYAFGVAVLGEVFRIGLERTAGDSLAGPLSGGEAGAVIAQGTDMAQLVHRAYANALDTTFVVAACFGVVAAIAVFVLVRPRRTPPEPDQKRPLVDCWMSPGSATYACVRSFPV